MPGSRAPMLALMLLMAFTLPGATDRLDVPAPAISLPREPGPFTFFAWSDQHVSADGDAEHLLPALRALRGLRGREYPPGVGGNIAQPAFIFSAGDCTDWPTRRAWSAYSRAVGWLDVPHIEILGNHDEGDGPRGNPMWSRIATRHGGPSYRLDCAGVSLLSIFSPHTDSQHLSDRSLAWLRQQLAELGPDRPAIIATHLSFAAIRNLDDLVDALGDANVILILGGHLHRTRTLEYRGRWFIQLPSPKGSPHIMVIRVDMDRLLAIPFDYRRGAWVQDPALRVDVPIRR
jgi:hypothetical protein